MGEAPPVLAGALFKWTNSGDLSSTKGAVYLLIEAGSQEDAIEQRDQLARNPELFAELLTTMRPWHREMVKIDYEMLNRHCSVKDIFFAPKTEEE